MSCMELGHTFEFPASMLAQAEDTLLKWISECQGVCESAVGEQ